MVEQSSFSPFIHCPVSNCFAENYDDMTLEASAYDAVVFHMANLWFSPPKLNRSPSQRYVLFSLESPSNVRMSTYYNGKLTF